jgi:hypothetical protein
MKNPIEYLNELINLLFSESNGKKVFFPWFTCGSGFVVDTKEKDTQIRSYLQKYYIILVAGGLLVGFILGTFLLSLMLILMGAWYYYQVNQFVSGLKKSDERLVIESRVKQLSKAFDLNELIGIAVVMILFILIGFFMIWKGGLISRFVGFSLMVVFGAKAYFLELVIRRKLSMDPGSASKNLNAQKVISQAKAEMSKVASKVKSAIEGTKKTASNKAPAKVSVKAPKPVAAKKTVRSEAAKVAKKTSKPSTKTVQKKAPEPVKKPKPKNDK